MSVSVAERMADVRNRSTGFDYLRFSLASGLILWHTIGTSYGAASQLEVPFFVRIAELSILPIFFTLSGFLVAGSLDRSPGLVTFFGLRVLRIVPALTAEVTLSALILGPLFTSLPLMLYFSDPVFRSYFLNILGDIHFSLPGMFLANPIPDMVNVQLWTIPFELKCYVALGIVAALGIVRRRAALFVLVVVAQTVLAARGIWGDPVDDRISVGGNMLILSFFFGVTIYAYRDVIPYDKTLAAIMCILMIILLAYGRTRFLSAFPAAYVTVYAGLLNPKRIPLVFSGDYSYGLYLYGFPLQQAVASNPELRHWYYNFAIAYPLAAACAIVSWWTLEKRALSLRRYLPSKAKSALAPVASMPETFVRGRLSDGNLNP